MGRKRKIKKGNRKEYDEIRWNLKTINIPRTKNLTNFFMMSNNEEEKEELPEELNNINCV